MSARPKRATKRAATPAKRAPRAKPAPRPATAVRRAGAGRAAAALRVLPATAERWADLTALFGSRGACGGCWCMWGRRTSAEFKAGRGERNRRALRRRVDDDPAPGLLAYDGATAVGWVAVGPREEFVRLGTSRVLAPPDEAAVWSVPCFFVASTHRGRGVSVALLRAAAAYAAAHGARALEGYPVDTRGKRQPAAFVWWGTTGAFRAAGFREVLRRSASRPIVRKALRRAAGSAAARRGSARRG